MKNRGMQGEERIGLSAAGGLGALVLAAFVAVTTEIVPVGLLPQLSRAFAVPEAVTGLLVTVFAALVVVLAVPLTQATRRLPRKPLLLGTVAMYAVANTVIALAPAFGVVVLGRVIGGAAHALFFSVFTAYAAALVPPRVQGRALAVATSGASLGYVLGVPLVTSIGAAVGWRAAFGALAVGALLIVLVASLLLPPVERQVVARTEARGARPALVAVAAANVVGFLGQYTLYTYVSALLIGAGLAETALGAVLFLLGAAGVVGLWLAGLVIDRRPRAGLLAALAVGTVCVVGLLALRAGPIPAVAGTTAWLVAFGGVPVFFAAATLRTRAVAPDIAGAVNNAASNAGIGSGALVGGLAFTAGGVPAVIVAASAAWVGAFVLVLVLRRGFPSRAPA